MTKETVTYLDVNVIQPNPYQPRREFDSQKLEELAESIDVQGLIQPIIVREVVSEDGSHHYELIAGERRLRAVRDILQKPRIKAIVTKEYVTNNQSEEAALVENIQRENLNPIDEVRAIVAIMDREDLTQEQVAKRLGKSRSEISNLVRLMRLPKDVQNLVAQGKIEKTKAWKLAMIPDEAKLKATAQKCVDQDWSFNRLRDEVEKITTIIKSDKAPKKSRAAPAQKVDLSRYVLVEFEPGDTAAINEFMAYMVEQGFKCLTNQAIMDTLKPTKAAAVETALVDEGEPSDVFADLLEESDTPNERIEEEELDES